MVKVSDMVSIDYQPIL